MLPSHGDNMPFLYSILPLLKATLPLLTHAVCMVSPSEGGTLRQVQEGKENIGQRLLKYCRQPDSTENIPQTSTPPLLVSYLTYILPSSGCFTSCFLHFTEMRGHPTSQSQCLSLPSHCLCCRQHERHLHDRQLRRYVQWI